MADKKQYDASYAIKHAFNELSEALKVELTNSVGFSLNSKEDSIEAYRPFKNVKLEDGEMVDIEGFSSAMFFSHELVSAEIQPMEDAPFFPIEIKAGKNDIAGVKLKVKSQSSVYVCLKG
jgi:hypothetical protein